MKKALSRYRGIGKRLLVGLLFASALTEAFAAEKLILTGSSTIAPLALEIGKRFEKSHPGIRVDVQAGGSSRGITDVRSGLAHIGMVSRALNADEKDLHAHTLAMDGLGVILHAANPVKTLSDDHVRQLYTGVIKRWNLVGGLDRPVTVVNKAEGRSTLELFLLYFQLKNSEIKAHVVIGDNQQGIKTVMGNPDAIGYVSIGSAEYAATHGTPIKMLPMTGIDASVENVRNGTFPLRRPLNLVTKEMPVGLTKTFLDFARSEATDDLINAQFFVPLAH